MAKLNLPQDNPVRNIPSDETLMTLDNCFHQVSEVLAKSSLDTTDIITLRFCKENLREVVQSLMAKVTRLNKNITLAEQFAELNKLS